MLNKFFNRNYLFREIYENNPRVNNLDPSVKLTRILIRFFVINFNYDISILFLKSINYLLQYFRINKINNKTKYITYLYKINFLYIEFINNLKKLKIDTAFEIKKKLASHICDHSFSYQHRIDARQYLKVLDGNFRALSPATMKLLDHLGFLSDSEKLSLKNHIDIPLKNHNNIITGFISATIS